jgi:TetR/AcrR family transcriptional repressor of uid operon
MSTPSEMLRTRHAEATRARLIEAASTMFVEQGYAEVTVRDLARACGVTTGALYAHFRNKAALLVEAIHERMRTDLEVPPRASGEPIDITVAVLGQFSTQHARSGLRALLLEGASAARRDPEVRAQLREVQLEYIEWWNENYRLWQDQNGIDPTIDTDAIVALLWSAELGLGMLEAWDLEMPPAPAMRHLAATILRSVGDANVAPVS